MDFSGGLGALGGLGAGLLGGWFGAQHDKANWQDPSQAAQGYFNQIPGTISPYYQQYMQQGSQAGNQLQGQYNNLINNPGGVTNQIGSSFHQSPGFNFALQQALQAGNNAAAAGGMAGSPQHQQQNMATATGLANQDYYNYLGNAENQYGQGLQGLQGMYQTGYGASNELANSLGSNLQSQGQLAYSGAANRNQFNLGQEGLEYGLGAQGLQGLFGAIGQTGGLASFFGG
jgi:hypothetical protein